jgi:hypothetical protein
VDSQLFYIVRPSLLEFPSVGTSLQQRRGRLAELIQATGAQWAVVRMRGADFMATVERLDQFIGADKDFVNSAFENSPRQILPIGSTEAYNPLLGYYEPDRVLKFDWKLRAIPQAVIDSWEKGSNSDLVGQVVSAFRSTFAEAARRGHAVALEHR